MRKKRVYPVVSAAIIFANVIFIMIFVLSFARLASPINDWSASTLSSSSNSIVRSTGTYSTGVVGGGAMDAGFTYTSSSGHRVQTLYILGRAAWSSDKGITTFGVELFRTAILINIAVIIGTCLFIAIKVHYDNKKLLISGEQKESEPSTKEEQ